MKKIQILKSRATIRLIRIILPETETAEIEILDLLNFSSNILMLNNVYRPERDFVT